MSYYFFFQKSEDLPLACFSKKLITYSTDFFICLGFPITNRLLDGIVCSFVKIYIFGFFSQNLFSQLNAEPSVSDRVKISTKRAEKVPVSHLAWPARHRTNYTPDFPLSFVGQRADFAKK